MSGINWSSSIAISSRSRSLRFFSRAIWSWSVDAGLEQRGDRRIEIAMLGPQHFQALGDLVSFVHALSPNPPLEHIARHRPTANAIVARIATICRL